VAAVGAPRAGAGAVGVAGAGEMAAAFPLFVYGTLRPCLIHRATAAPRQVVETRTHLGEAVFAGLLFDLGEYPGVVEDFAIESANARRPASSRPSRVIGDLLAVTDGDLEVLDTYEECGGRNPLYRRECRTVTCCSDTKPIECWIYIYNHEPPAEGLIPHGDYRRHLAEHRR